MRTSAPSQSKSSLTRTRLKVQARQVPEGMENAIAPVSMRIPLGPSEQHAAGSPNRTRLSVRPPNADAVPGVTLGEHMPSPRVKHARSSSESWARNASMVTFPSATSLRRYPRSPV